MKVLASIGAFAMAWVVIGATDDLSGYHAATDISEWVPRIHDAITLLWGSALGGAAGAAIFARR
jgi:hypothetical protein